MRFNDWDVLLFPLTRDVPIPEFKIEAYSVDDLEAPPIVDTIEPGSHQHPSPPSPVRQSIFDSNATTFPIQGSFSYVQMPLLACFVASQDEGMHFKVSIHNWKQMNNSVQPTELKMRENVPCFQARVFIDGHLVSGDVIKPDTCWPLKIEKSFSVMANVPRANLRWPRFHEEQLSQNYWRAGDNYGRIKVVVSKGMLNLETGLVSSPQNLVAFAFQHAPMAILRGANIAWSADGMGLKPDRLIKNTGSGNQNVAVELPTTEMAFEASSLVHPWSTNGTHRSIMIDNPMAISNQSSFIFDEEMDGLSNVSTTAIGVAQAQSLRVRPGNAVLVDNILTGTLASRTNQNDTVPQTPQRFNLNTAAGIAAAQINTPDHGNKSQLGSPKKENLDLKAEQENEVPVSHGNSTTSNATKGKAKATKPTARRTKVIKPATTPSKVTKSPPTKATKGRKPAAAKKVDPFKAAATPALTPPDAAAAEPDAVSGAVEGLISLSHGAVTVDATVEEGKENKKESE